MGGINTVVLILSSLTVALAIDRIQRGKQKAAVWLLGATIVFAGCFLVVKYFEYTGKFHHDIFPGNAKNIVVDDATHAYGPIPKYLHVATSKPISAAAEVAALDEIVRKASPSGKQAIADGLAEKGAALVDKKGIDLFFTFYFMMTGIHGLHVIIGMSVLLVIMVKTMRGTYSHWHYTAMENGGLYWHLVDLIWIYLFPLMYLIK
jgi:cytochrome c oxidase subunit 3